MPGPLTLDASAATWLAGLDPALSLLPRALPPTSTRPQWSLHDARWTPGEGCRLAYRVDPGGSASTFMAVNVTPVTWSQHDYREDPTLPGLPSASDSALVGDLLAPHCEGPIRRCRIEPVRYRPGSRCVLRYDVETAAGRSTFYAKAFRPERFSEVYPLGTALGAADGGNGLVPEATTAWPDLHVIVGAAIRGRAVSAVLGDPAVPAGERVRLAHRLGDLLARFHRQSGVTAPRWSAADQVAGLATSMAAVRSGDAGLGDRLSSVCDVLAAHVPACGTEVLGHGGFRAGQVVLSDDGRLIVLDTDGLCLCAPGRDLGSVLAHLRWQGVRHPEQQQVLCDAGRALLSGYQGRAGAVDTQALLWWRAAGLLQVAVRRYRRLEIADWPAVPTLVDAAAELLARQSHLAAGGATSPLDTSQMATALGAALGRPACPPLAVVVESADELASSSARRSVVRYAVRGLDGPHAVAVVGKTFTESRRARLLHDHLRLLHEGPFRAGDLRVPEPLAIVPQQRLVLYRHCDGTPLDLITVPAQAEEGVRGAARWLARLHTSDVRLPRTFSLEQEERSTKEWATLVGQIHPSLAPQAHSIADRWVAATRSAGHNGVVPIHKDFHPGHVLVGDDLYVIDLDEARQGDPGFDVAHFCCYLERAPGDWNKQPLHAAFLKEYAAHTGWMDNGTYAPFCAYTWLKIAKQWAVGSGPCREASPARRMSGVARALAKGNACLSE